jgi:hypothetical protein
VYTLHAELASPHNITIITRIRRVARMRVTMDPALCADEQRFMP